MVATLGSVSLAEGQRLVVVLESGDAEPSSGLVELRVFEIDHIATRWKMSAPTTVRESGGGLIAEVDVTASLDPGTLYEAALIRRDSEKLHREMWIQSDPDRLLFEIRSEGGVEADNAGLRERHLEILRARERFFERSFGDGSAANTYRAMILVRGLLMTTDLRASGLRVQPVDVPRGSEWDAQVLNQLLFGSGWGSSPIPLHGQRETCAPDR